MRTDFPKLLCERPRLGGYHDTKYGRALNKSLDEDGFRKDLDGPNVESMSYKKHWGKSLNENLNPLIRFLERNVGRNWNAVYSEIKASVKNDSATKYHIYQHLWQFVRKDVVIEGRGAGQRVYEKTRSRALYGSSTFYIHPKKRTLERAPTSNPDYHRNKHIKPKVIEQGIIALKRDGVWYAVTMEVKTNVGWEEDVWISRPSHIDIGQWLAYDKTKAQRNSYGDGKLRAVSKRQLNTKEIKALGLS